MGGMIIGEDEEDAMPLAFLVCNQVAEKRGGRSGASFVFLCGRRIIGIRDGEFGFHLGLPGDELVLQFLGLVRMLLGQVVLFGWILGQVVKLDLVVVIEFDQFPVPVADGRARFPSRSVIVRVVPIEWSLLSFFPVSSGSRLRRRHATWA